MLVTCTNNNGYSDIRTNVTYDVVNRDDDPTEGMVRIIDDSGQDSLYPKDWFAEIPRKYCYDYPMPAITCDVVVFWKDYVLLVKRGREPYKNFWSTPGGFLNLDETLEQCALRELKEETGLEVDWVEFLFFADAVDRDERGRVVTAFFGTIINSETMPVVLGADDAESAHWVHLNDIKPEELAFDHEINIQKAIRWSWDKEDGRRMPLCYDKTFKWGNVV